MKTICWLIFTWLTISLGFCQPAKKFLDQGREKIKLNNYGEAIAYFSKAIQLDPQNSDALFLRGSLRIIIDDSSGAIADLEKALENIPKNRKEGNDKSMIITNNSCIYCHLGYLKARLDDPEAAISYYDKAIEANPERGESYYRRGLVRLMTGKREDGWRDLSKAKELGYKQADEALKNYCPN